MSGDTPPPLPANQAVVAVNTAGGSPRQVPRRASAAFMLGHPARWLALGFGSGLAPVAPGTVGTLWGWAAFVIARPFLDDLAWAWLIAASVLVGWWACTRTAQHLGTADPGAIVLWLVMPTSLLGQLVAFGLFRYFDAAKPGPVGWADRLFKLRPGEAIGWRQGFGILFDDVVAALCTLGVIALWHRLSTWWSP